MLPAIVPKRLSRCHSLSSTCPQSTPQFPRVQILVQFLAKMYPGIKYRKRGLFSCFPDTSFLSTSPLFQFMYLDESLHSGQPTLRSPPSKATPPRLPFPPAFTIPRLKRSRGGVFNSALGYHKGGIAIAICTLITPPPPTEPNRTYNGKQHSSSLHISRFIFYASPSFSCSIEITYLRLEWIRC